MLHGSVTATKNVGKRRLFLYHCCKLKSRRISRIRLSCVGLVTDI